MAGQNRIVVDYGDYEGLMLLGAYDNRTGEEINRSELEKLEGFEIVKKYDGVNDFTKLKGMIADNAEGFVIRFKNGFRMKIKGEEYVRLHRILTNFSNVDIWEYLKDGKNFNDFLDRVPDEFDLWVKKVKEDLEYQYETLDKEYKWIFKILMRSSVCETKKGFAEFAKRYKHPSILFKMFDGKDYSDYIWKQIRPVYQKPFWSKSVD